IRRMPAGVVWLMSFALSCDGQMFAAVYEQDTKKVHLLDLASGTERSLLPHKQGVDCMAFSPDGKLLASGGSDQELRLWDTTKGREIQSMNLGRSRTTCVTFSPDGKTLAVGEGDNVKLRDVPTLEEHATLPTSRVHVASLAFSPDGKRLVGGGQKFLCIWDVSTRKLQQRIPYFTGSHSVRCLAFTPDGKVLASTAGCAIRLWDSATGKQIHERSSHEGEVGALAVSP